MEKPPRRETKKAATRRALVAAANRLFHRSGYERTTIDDICAEVGVSRRTFFRYFESKEALAFPHRAERLERFVELLDATSTADSPVDGLRRVAAVFAREYSANREQLIAQQRLIESVPSLRAREHEIDQDWEHAMARAFQRHFGPDAAAKRRAHVLAGAAIGVIRATMRHWYGNDGRPDLGRLGNEALDGLERGFFSREARDSLSRITRMDQERDI